MAANVKTPSHAPLQPRRHPELPPSATRSMLRQSNQSGTSVRITSSAAGLVYIQVRKFATLPALAQLVDPCHGHADCVSAPRETMLLGSPRMSSANAGHGKISLMWPTARPSKCAYPFAAGTILVEDNIMVAHKWPANGIKKLLMGRGVLALRVLTLLRTE